jgi:NADPH:quinone reductase-like Zn-dependent oxidoreductase
MPEQLMQAIRVHQYGGPEQLKLERILRPEPLTDEVLVRIHAAGVLPIEWKVRQGLFQAFNPVSFPYIPGSAFAGVIEEVGVGVMTWKAGQEVFGRSLKGTYAEYTTVSAETIALKPVSLSFSEAATISGGATTAWEALFDRGALQSGQSVLILGAAGGVGHFAVQFAKWKGAKVLGTAGSANVDFVSSLGAQTVIDYTIMEASQIVRDMDLVLDTVGGPTLATVWPSLKRGGTLISIAGMPSQERARELGIRAQFFAGSPPSRERLQTIAQLIDDGQVKVTFAQIFLLSQANLAHELSQGGHGRGRIVLHIADYLVT